MSKTEMLLGGQCYIAMDSKIDVLLKNSNERLPNIEGIINHFDINFRFYCKNFFFIKGIIGVAFVG